MWSERRVDLGRGGDRRSAGSRQAILLCGLALPLLVAFYALVLVYWAHPASTGDQLRIDQFLSLVERGQVHSATILSADSRMIGTYGGGEVRYWVDFSGGHESLFARLTGALEDAAVPTTVRAQPLKNLVLPVSMVLPVVILADLVMLLFLVAKRGSALGAFGTSSVRRVGDGGPTFTFADVAGADEAVEELTEIRDFLADPGRFAVMGAAAPKGVLLSGPPGCGKTRLAQALAGESAVPFFSISGTDFVEIYVGVGAARIRDLFTRAKESAPAVVFIDEVDAVGRSRSMGVVAGSEEREATLNQLLVEMDGFDAEAGVVVVAATNRPDMLDAALLRPGRFDRRIRMELPDVHGREAILSIHARNKPLGGDVELRSLARRTSGFSGADLANVVNEAAFVATRRQSSSIDASDLSEAVDRVVAGPTRRSRILSLDDRRRIAVHEAGHAIVGSTLPRAGGVTKVSILARGHAGGSTMLVPDADRALATRGDLVDRITTLLGGRAAEELCLGEPSTGSNDDLVRATDLARRLVWQCGMSKTFGPVAMSPTALGLDLSAVPWSEQTAGEVDAESRAILLSATARADEIVAANRPVLDRLVAALLEAETLEGEELAGLLAAARCVARAEARTRSVGILGT